MTCSQLGSDFGKAFLVTHQGRKVYCQRGYFVYWVKTCILCIIYPNVETCWLLWGGILSIRYGVFVYHFKPVKRKPLKILFNGFFLLFHEKFEIHDNIIVLTAISWKDKVRLDN